MFLIKKAARCGALIEVGQIFENHQILTRFLAVKMLRLWGLEQPFLAAAWPGFFEWGKGEEERGCRGSVAKKTFSSHRSWASWRGEGGGVREAGGRGGGQDNSFEGLVSCVVQKFTAFVIDLAA